MHLTCTRKGEPTTRNGGRFSRFALPRPESIFHAIIILRSRRMEIYEQPKRISLSEHFFTRRIYDRKAKQKAKKNQTFGSLTKADFVRVASEIIFSGPKLFFLHSNRWYRSSWQDVSLNHSRKELNQKGKSTRSFFCISAVLAVVLNEKSRRRMKMFCL